MSCFSFNSFLSLLLNWHWKAIVMIYICLVSGRAIGSLVYGHSPCIKCRLSTWARWAVALGPTNIGAHANLCMLYTACFFTPAPGGGGGILFYLCPSFRPSFHPPVLPSVLPSVCPSVLPSVQYIFRRIFLSNYRWQKSDI